MPDAPAAPAATGLAEANRTKLIVHTAIEPEQIELIGATVIRAPPEIELVWVRASTGAITDRLIAGKDAPKGRSRLRAPSTRRRPRRG